MQHRIITSVAVLMGALILAIIAGVVPVLPFSTEETAYAQTPDRPNDATLMNDATGLALTVGIGAVGAAVPFDDPRSATAVVFASGITEYTARVANSVNVVTVSAVTNNPGATYSVNSGTIDTPTPVTLRAGQKTRITVSVVAVDRRTRQTYTVMVYRDSSGPLSEKNDLSALSLSGVGLSPRFSSGTTEYDARVRYDVTTVTVSATAADIGALVSGVAVVGGDTDDVTNDVVDLNDPGMDTVIAVTVAPESGLRAGNTDNDEEYRITVYRESGPVLSNDATLGGDNDAVGLSLGATAPLEPAFNPNITEYTARAGNTVASVTVSATANDAPGAKRNIRPADEIPPADNEATPIHQVYLTPGANTVITVTVTAEDRSTNTYTVTVYQDRVDPSGNDTLSALSLTEVMTLSPAFDPGTTDYDAKVPYDVQMVTVEATAADIGAMDIVVAFNTDLNTDTINAPSVDAATNRDVTLGGVGHKTGITITVTPENGMAVIDNAYTITVYRESGPVLSNDATLVDATGLSLTAGTAADGTAVPLGVTFASDMTEYTANVGGDTDTAVVTVTVAPANRGATFEIMPADLNTLDGGHQVYLTPGANNPITVTVTAEDGSTEQAYTVTIYRSRSNTSDNANLSALSLTGVMTLSPAFDPGTTGYDARVRYDVDEVTVERTVADIGG